MVLYVGHDSSILNFLASMNYISAQCLTDFYLDGIDNAATCALQTPGFASSFIIELYLEDNGSYSIRVRLTYILDALQR